MTAIALRAPKEHGAVLAAPPLAEVGALLAENRRRLQAFPSSLHLQELRSLARREILALAADYHLEAGEAIPEKTSDVWIVAGHQPELFHPGVWFKNFALHRLSEIHGALPLNLVIDTDAAKPALLHAPHGSHVARVPFDRTSTETAYEERTVAEEAIFASLPERMAPITAGYGFEPMLGEFWAEALKQAKRTPLLGERFAAARRVFERRWGCVQREVPMSRVCQTQAFAHFASLILDRLVEFHAIYNETVHEYRRTHGIRSRSHPVPDLARDGDWLEAPFWAWRRGSGRRGRLMVRAIANAWEFKIGGEVWPAIPPGIDGWRSLEPLGYKIRSRALTTTMFARLFFADLFIHGIGGGLYDQLTDRILERFFLIRAPAYMVLSATLLMPIHRYPDAAARMRELDRQLRDLTYKPELFVRASETATPLLQAKQAWIARPCATHAERLERFHRIRNINARLLETLGPRKSEMEAERARQVEYTQTDAVAARRDYPFCLYPESMLRDYFTATLRGEGIS